MLCKKCKTNEVYIQKRKLCVSCYQRWYMKNGRIGRWITHDLHRKRVIKNAIQKYGVGFIKDIVRLNYKPFWTLQMVGDKYNMTRERIRQIYTDIYSRPLMPIATRKTKKVKKQSVIVCKKDPKYKIAEYKTNSTAHLGAKIELLFLQRCEEYGLSVAPACNTVVDFIINNKKVEVKSSTPKILKGTIIPRFIFAFRPQQFRKMDFAACYHSTNDSFFIIPKEKITSINTVSFLEEKSDYYNALNKYFEYENAFHLLAT